MFINHGPLFEMFLYALVTLFILWLMAPSSKVAAPVVEDAPSLEETDEACGAATAVRQDVEALTLLEDQEMREETALDVLKGLADELHQQPIAIDSTSAAPRLGWEVATQPDYTTPALEIVEEAPPVVEASDPLTVMPKTRLKALAAKLNKQSRIEGYTKMEPAALMEAIRNHPNYTKGAVAS